MRPPRERPISWREGLEANPLFSRPPSAGGRGRWCCRSSGRWPARVALVESFEDDVPDPRKCPAPELPIDPGPFGKARVEVTPGSACAGDPEDRIEDRSMILRTPAAPRALAHQKRREDRPLLIRHQTTNHDRSPAKSSLESDRSRFGNPLCQHRLAMPPMCPGNRDQLISCPKHVAPHRNICPNRHHCPSTVRS